MKRTLTALLLIAGFSGGAFAQSFTFEELDANQDGVLTEDEAALIEGLDFATLDVNADGLIDRAEWDAARGGSEG